MTKTLAAGTVPGRGHHHRQRAAILFGGVDHRAIAGEIGLTGEHVHRLCARDARHQLHGEGDETCVRHLLERGFVAVRVHDGDDQRAFLIGGQFARCRAAHFQDEIGVLDDVVTDGRAGRLEVGVGNARGDAGAACHRNLGAERLEFLDGLRRRRDPRLMGVGFTRNGNSHHGPRVTGVLTRLKTPRRRFPVSRFMR